MHSVAFVLSPGFQIIELNAAMAFQLADEIAGGGHYRLGLFSAAGGAIESALGVAISTKALGEEAYDTVFCIGPTQPSEASAETVETVKALAARARRMAASNTFLLAQAGLLDGRRATTHWSHAAELQRRYPQVRVESERLFLSDGTIWTSAGMSAVLDLALALIEDDLGARTAREIAKRLVMYFRRPGEQPQISALLRLEPQMGRIRRVLAYARTHLSNASLSVEELAGVANLSPRQFSRLFRQETGQSPAKAVETLRIEAARSMLDQGGQTLEAVARQAGFSDRDRMRRAFLRTAGHLPGALGPMPAAMSACTV